MVNLQDYILKSELFKTFEVDELLFVEYRCLINDHQSDIWTHHNYLAYVLGGKKKGAPPGCAFPARPGFIPKPPNRVGDEGGLTPDLIVLSHHRTYSRITAVSLNV